MYYTVGSQCPKIPIPDRVPIAELFSSEWLLLNLNSFSQDLPLCLLASVRTDSSTCMELLAASLGMSTSILLTSAFSSDQKRILFTADSRSSNVALASAISFVLLFSSYPFFHSRRATCLTLLFFKSKKVRSLLTCSVEVQFTFT